MERTQNQFVGTREDWVRVSVAQEHVKLHGSCAFLDMRRNCMDQETTPIQGKVEGKSSILVLYIYTELSCPAAARCNGQLIWIVGMISYESSSACERLLN